MDRIPGCLGKRVQLASIRPEVGRGAGATASTRYIGLVYRDKGNHVVCFAVSIRVHCGEERAVFQCSNQAGVEDRRIFEVSDSVY